MNLYKEEFMKQAIFAKWLLAITATHLFLGTIIFYLPLLQLLQQGWWNTVGPNNLETAIAFWFMLFGFPLLMLIYSMWGSSVLVSRGFLYFSLIGSILAGLAIPFSGIWTLTLLCTVALIMSNRKETLN
jgi:hypothetical protein